MDVVDGVRVTGPLAPYARGFAVELARLGFTRGSAQKPLQLAAHVSRWLGDAGLGAGDVTAFMTAESRRLAPKTVQRLATALRSLLRFWHLQGLITAPLDQVVPRIANRRPGLPQPLEQGQVAELLASCDLQAATG